MLTEMKLVLWADRDRPELEPLTSSTTAALLPVLGKPLIEHALEDLYEIGAREVLVVVSDFSQQVKKTLGTGRRWGMKLSYELTRGDESMDEICGRFGDPEFGEALFVRADILRSPSAREFLARAGELLEAGRVEARIGGRSAGIDLIRSQKGAWELLELEGGRLAPLESLASYHRANLEALEGRFGLEPFALEKAPGVWAGRKAQLPSEAVEKAPILVGSRCRVHETARLKSGTVLSSDVLVDRGAVLGSTVVLPGTYVGEGVELEQSIVWGNLLVRVDSGMVAEIDNASWLADLENNPVGEVGREAINRLLGMVLLVLSAPFCFLMLIASLFENARHPFRRVLIESNRRAVGNDGRIRCQRSRVWEGATHIPLLRFLPRLLAVVSGHLRLVGVRAAGEQVAPAGRARGEAWYKIRDSAARGLLSPALATTCSGGSPLEAEMADVLFALGADGFGAPYWLGRHLKVLFSAAAWRPSERDHEAEAALRIRFVRPDKRGGQAVGSGRA